jgi:DNA-binding MarR family transcriptional regulator
MGLSAASPEKREALNQVANTLLIETSRLTRLLMRSAQWQLTRTEAGLLGTLSQGPRRSTELAKTETLTQPAVSKLLDKLENQGLLRRERDSADRRVVIVFLSDQGRQSLASAHRELSSQLRLALQVLDDDDIAVLARAAELIDRLNQMLGQGQR